MYDKAHHTWNNVLKSHETEDEDAIELTAKCYLSPVYPKKHLLQGVDRQDLWYALCNDNLNTLYADGVSLQTLTLPRDDKESFDYFIGMDCPPQNWNEGLDPGLTEDLHLICQFRKGCIACGTLATLHRLVVRLEPNVLARPSTVAS